MNSCSEARCSLTLTTVGSCDMSTPKRTALYTCCSKVKTLNKQQQAHAINGSST